MSHSTNHYGKHGGGHACGITAPYCPPPACPPPMPMACMEPPCEVCRKPKAQPLERAAYWPRPIKPCPPPYQTGVVCVPPPVKPAVPKCENVLMQKILCCEKRHIPQLCVRLEWCELKGCPPYRLTAVHQSGAQPWWKPLESHGPDARRHILVSIPVCCQICDREGKMQHMTAVAEAEVSLRGCGTQAENWHSSLFIVPCVRLAGGDVCSEDGCFCVQLEVTLEIYLLRPEPCAVHYPEAVCPDLPLYPMPRSPRHPWEG